MIKQPITLPPNRAWTQPNTGFIFGSIYSSRNVSFDVPGVVSLSARTTPLLRQAVSGSDLDNVLAIAYGEFGATASGFSSTEQYIVVSDDELFLLAGALNNIGVLTNTSGPTMSDYSDGIAWNDGFYCTTTSNLSKLVAGTWTNSLMSLTSAKPHPLERSASANYLLVGNDNLLEKRTVAGVNSTALTLPSNYQIVWIRSDYSRTLIGARTKDGTNSSIFEWDEVAPTWTNKYDLDFTWPYSGCFRNTDFFVVSNDGRLMKYNGGGFSTVAQWPIYDSQPGFWAGNVDTLIANPVYQRSMAIVRGRLTINMNTKVDYGQYSAEAYENFPAGVWDFEESTGLTHRWGLTAATDKADFCQMQFANGSGAIFPVFIEDTPPNPTNGSLFITGARVDYSTTEYYTVQTVVSGGSNVNVGQLTTTRIETTDIADDAKKLWVKFRGVFESTDLIRFKYKDRWLKGLPFFDETNGSNGVTWTSTTVFTSVNPLWANVLALGSDGGKCEVTIASGDGGGAMRHIVSISLNTGTYTVTLDEAVAGVVAADKSAVLVDNFKLLDETITNADVNGYKAISITQTDPRTWVQTKMELRGTEYVTIEETQLVPASDILATT